MAGTIQQFDFSVDLLQALLWQYERATRLQAILTAKSAWYAENQTAFWSNWYRDVFDLRTANDFGLTVWARILGFPLVAGVPGSGDRPVFGFDPTGENFENGTFGLDENGVLTLTTEQKRLVLFLRYFQLTSNGTPVQINEFLARTFADLGRVYVQDGLDMTCTYLFEFAPPASLVFILENFDILPRPAGVELKVLISPAEAFGFAPYYLNFNHGVFK